MSQSLGHNNHIYTIKAVADKLNIHPRTLRLYEENGFILPYRDPNNNYRLYSENDIDRIRAIHRLLHEERLNIEGLKQLLIHAPCWKIIDCPEDSRRNCPAFKQPDRNCWEVIAEDDSEAISCNKEDCPTCPIYLVAQKDEGNLRLGL